MPHRGLIIVSAVVLAVLALGGSGSADAQLGFGRGGGPPRSAQESAPIDLTGQWVSIVTEDWRFRMTVPPKGDYPGLPLNRAAQEVAANWDPAREEAAGNACKAYGVAGIMRMPTRLRIDWTDDSTLEIRTDAGRQTRQLQFAQTPDRSGEGSWQGVSTAEWELHGRSGNGDLKVVTTGMREGFFRKNGVPYSADAVLTEYYDLLIQHDGTEWLVIVSVLDDPTYFTQPIITSTNFRRESGRAGWNPTECRVD
jgi:hypothetical protein